MVMAIDLRFVEDAHFTVGFSAGFPLEQLTAMQPEQQEEGRTDQQGGRNEDDDDGDEDQPTIVDGGRSAEELEDFVTARWWNVTDIIQSPERFYPSRLPELLPRFLAEEEIHEPFEYWDYCNFTVKTPSAQQKLL